MSLIPGYPKGSNITILNTMYQGRRRDQKTNKITEDFLMILFKDNETGEKKIHTIYSPEYTFYKIKDEFVTDYNLFFIEKDKCEPINVKYADLLREIAKMTGNSEWFYDNIRNGNSGENRRLHTVKELMFSDMDIEDFYRFKFSEEYVNDSFKLKKAFADIEVDGKYQKGDFPEMGECPINAISMIDEYSNKIYTFLLRTKDNPLIGKFEHSIGPEFFSKLKNFVIDKVGGWKQAKRMGVYDIDYQLMFFDDEMELIKSFFNFIHNLNPDFLEFWNMAFDLEYIIERIKVLGYFPEDIICDPRIEEKIVRFYVDERNKNEFAERGDFASISLYTVFLDQMIQFASRRKGRSQYTSFSLDSIGEVVARVTKLSYADITTNIAELPYLNYETFVMYNIFDTIVQKCIEAKSNDLEYIFNKCLVNNTRYQKGHRQSVYLANRFTKEFYKDGYIIGNNCNKWNPKPGKFPGALVGDPTHTSDYAKLIINGRASMIAKNLMDYDYKSLYPSIMGENNMAPNTQIGMIEMPEKVYEHENVYNKDIEAYSRSGEYLDNLISGNIIEFCKRYFHLAGYKEVIDDMIEYFSMAENHSTAPIQWFDNDGKSLACWESSDAGEKYEAISFSDDYKENAIDFYYSHNGYTDLVNDLKKVVHL